MIRCVERNRFRFSPTLIVSPDHGPRHSRTAAARVGDGARDAELPGQGRGELTAGGQAVRIEVRLRAGGSTQEDHAGSDGKLIQIP